MMSMSIDIFVPFSLSLVISSVFYFLEQVHMQEWRFVVYLKECLLNVRTHGSFWKWAYTIIVKSFYLLLQGAWPSFIGLIYYPSPSWNVGL